LLDRFGLVVHQYLTVGAVYREVLARHKEKLAKLRGKKFETLVALYSA
jgi:hypothetical protein